MAVLRTLADYTTEMSDHGFGDLPPAAITRAINNAYSELCSMERWPFLVKEWTGALTPSFATVSDLPPDAANLISFTVDSQQQTLTPVELDEYRKRFVGHYTDVGLPYLYYFVGIAHGSSNAPIVKVYPLPDQAYPYLIEYRQQPIDMSAPTDSPEVPPTAQRLISYMALSLLHAQEDNPQMASYWETRFLNGVGRLREDMWTQQTDRPNTILNVADWDDGYP